MKKIITGILIVFWSNLVFASVYSDVERHKNCVYCGMDRHKYSHSRMLVIYEDGSEIATCSLHCTAIELSVNIDKDVKKIEVADYNTMKMIDAEKAFWVIGGNIQGVMTKNAKWAFEKKEDAEKFIKQNDGKLANFEEAIKTAYNDMYNDTKMIRDKRKKMKKSGNTH